MTHPNSHESNPITTAQVPDEFKGLISTLRESYNNSHNTMHELYELYLSGDPEKLTERLENIAYAVLESCPIFVENRDKLKNPKAHKIDDDEARKISAQQRIYVSDTIELIALEAGIPLETVQDDITRSRENVKQILESAIEEGKITEPEDALRVLGIIVTDKDDNDVFVWPDDLFPESVNKLWYYYLELVVEHTEEDELLKRGSGNKMVVKDLDYSRRSAHTRAAKAVASILEIDTTKQGWSLEETRNLLAKMRDHKFPNVDTSESKRTAEEILDGHSLALGNPTQDRKLAIATMRELARRPTDTN